MGDFLNEWNWLEIFSVVVRLVLCMIFAGMIGFERQGRYHPAGMRTHILVCIGSAITMMLGQYLFVQYGADPARIGAQVVSGIGFLGVGTIISNGGHVRGITTAAGLWASACMGLSLGAGMYVVAILGFLAIEFTMVVMRRLNMLYFKRHAKQLYLLVQIRSLSDLVYITKLLRVWGVTVQSTEMESTNGHEETDEDYRVLFQLQINGNVDCDALLMELHQEDRILYAEYIKGEKIRAAANG